MGNLTATALKAANAACRYGDGDGLYLIRIAAFALLLSTSITPCLAQEAGSDDFTFEEGILVTSSDVVACAYRSVQVVSVNVTEDYNADTRGKIVGKFRKEAKKLNADAIISVTKGKTHMTAWAWNRREYTGKAIRYVDRSCMPTAL